MFEQTGEAFSAQACIFPNLKIALNSFGRKTIFILLITLPTLAGDFQPFGCKFGSGVFGKVWM